MSRRTTNCLISVKRTFTCCQIPLYTIKMAKRSVRSTVVPDVYVKIDKISKYVQQGYMSSEDKKFMEHGGVNLQSENPCSSVSLVS